MKAETSLENLLGTGVYIQDWNPSNNAANPNFSALLKNCKLGGHGRAGQEENGDGGKLSFINRAHVK